ncbi:MAG: S1/P1 Nuclease [Proteobacteria bacterium]|nr:S1/P1 Nuclease [Pseudomonadota bacterium]
MTITATVRSPRFLSGLAGMCMLAASCHAWSWGHTGHVEISRIAIEKLPEELPAFLRNDFAAATIGELGPEADESKTTGIFTGIDPKFGIQTTRTVHDQERDPGHFMDIDDTGIVTGGKVMLSMLPATRETFDTAERAGGQTQYAGYLPYEMLDGFQQLRKDFGMWRAFKVGLLTSRKESDRKYFLTHLALREQLIIRDLGYWSHFVADASQPMHVSIHFNGWGPFPNDNGFTQDKKFHAQFEGSFVRNFIDFRKVAEAVRPYTDRGVSTNEARVPLYLAETLSQVVPVYQAALSSGNDNYTSAKPLEVAIVTQQLAAGASELRDEIVDAWNQSTQITVGFPLVTVADILSGAAVVTPATFGAD